MMTKPQTKTLALTDDQLSAVWVALGAHLDKHREAIRAGYDSDSHIGSAVQAYNMITNLRIGNAPDWNLERVPLYLRGD